MRIEARGGERPDADAIGLVLVAAREIDLLLCRGSLRDGHGSLDRVAATAGSPEHHRAQHQRRRQEALPAVGMDGPRDMALCHMGNLVRDHAREFILAAGGLDQPGVYTDIAAGQGKCVDVRVVHDEEREGVIAIVGLRRDAMPDVIDVLGNLSVFDDGAAQANIAHDLPPDLRLDRLREDSIRRAAHVGQLDVVRAGAAHEYHGGHGKQYERAFQAIDCQRKFSRSSGSVIFDPRAQGLFNMITLSRTSSAWPFTLTLRHSRRSLPSASIRKVLRSTPMNFRP